MKRIFGPLFLYFLTSLFFCSPTPKQPAKLGGELVIGPDNPLNGLDPAVVDHILCHTIAFQLFDGLLQYHPGDFKLIPALAETWETSDGGHTWIFHLRRGVHFNNDACFPDGAGREVVAADSSTHSSASSTGGRTTSPGKFSTTSRGRKSTGEKKQKRSAELLSSTPTPCKSD